MKKILYSLFVCAAAVGCSSDLVGEMPTERSYDINISSGVETSSASKAVVVEANDLTGITFLQVDATTTTLPATKFQDASTFLGNRANGALKPIVFTTATPPRYSLDDKNAFLKAYYPTVAATAGVVTWPIDGKTDILISDGVYAAGKYSATQNSTMLFKHQLAQLEVVCTADPDADVAATRDVWGKITSIELVGTPASFTYTYSTDAVTSTGSKTTALVKPDYTTNFTAVDLAKSNVAATAAGMFAPATGTNALSLLVKTVKVPTGVTVNVQLKDGTTNKGFEVGKKHTATLSFKADAKNIEVKATTIDAWGTGYTGSTDVTKP